MDAVARMGRVSAIARVIDTSLATNPPATNGDTLHAVELLMEAIKICDPHAPAVAILDEMRGDIVWARMRKVPLPELMLN